VVFLAELGLDGRLRPVPGILPAVLATIGYGIGTVVAPGNRAKASIAADVTVIAAGHLADVASWLRGGPPPEPESPGPADGSSPETE
jgi:magnesium chelatase family protein